MTTLKDEVSWLQAWAKDTMNDSCVLQQRSDGAADPYNTPAISFADVETTICGYNPAKHREVPNDVELIDATLRLPSDILTPITSVDRVKLTHRYGQALSSPIFFNIHGLPRVGLSATVVELQKVTDGT